MKIVFTLLLLSVVNLAFCQPPPRLIVRGDDMGFSHSGNQAILKASREGIQTSVEIIVPSPWFPEAVDMLKANPGIDVGIHLAITSEWDNVKWRPLTDCPTLQDADGYFFPMVHSNKNYPGRAIKDHQIKIEEVEREFRAQIELALKKLPRITHISSHMGCTSLNEAVKEMSRKLAREYKIDIDLSAHGVISVSYDGPHKTPEEKLKSFIGMLNNLESGKTYLFVDHPGLDSPELRAIHHIGYEDVASDRQGVTDLWTSEEVKKVLKERGIELISYGALRR
jgi:predicted glycoside hydrolase/deacetylase ChbG (UPF0249 family)